jgi:hypothetical protein
MHLLGRPVAPDKTLPRPDFVSWSKFDAEGTLAEIQPILGWCYNTRTMILCLPMKNTVPSPMM